ncbi:MAG: hypothetical protein HOM71_11095 [Deltaproteobacteria bacterium]|jgi:hypothetical protein|nr:hypothetical protein [Deltaproteobacteria bacterium]MBT4630067.1 hypothetical protein [Deltaproteobacteria bacterium]MBT5088013.1 hypothetical protein [Deltaproteobacteria bacterium]MBT5485904.1 hypothetical protein [Deltaproteobacteria bacterium]MBT5834737.1 hypothetical protein [Deltaproteobacteria bacterium]
MSALRFSSLIILFPILFAACGRSELIRIRMLAPVTEDKKDYAIFTDTESTATPVIINKQIGGSLYFLFKSIGLGYTTITTKMEKMTDTTHTEKTTLVTNFTDVAFGIGENYSFMWGAGVLSGGKRETSLEYGGSAPFNPKNNYLGGHSIFFVLGHHGFGFETLLGYRTNFIKAEFEESNLPSKVGKTGKEFTYESNKLSFTTSQVQLGIGFTF